MKLYVQAVEEAAARKRAKEEKMKNKSKENETKATESKEETGEPPVPAKAKRTSKNALKVGIIISFFRDLIFVL